MQPGRLGDGRDAHQTINAQGVFTLHALEKGLELRGRDPRLLRLLAGIDLDQKARRTARGIDRLPQGGCQTVAIKGFDDIEQFNGLVRLIALQWPDQAQFHVWIVRAALGPMLAGLLHAIFTEHALACSKCGLELFVLLPL